MTNYIVRLDDACPWRDIEKWDRMEALLDRYSIRPLAGVIPHCEDVMCERYEEDKNFWSRVDAWRHKGWKLAVHGYNHVYSTDAGGINPVNARSEFAGESLETQCEKISKAVEIFRAHGIEPEVFFAPSHTFDDNTLAALRQCSNIRIISDTIASTPYLKDGFTFVPQQSGRPRKLPFRYVTICMHPNEMKDADFESAEAFFKEHSGEFTDFPTEQAERRYSIIDRMQSKFYFSLRTVKLALKGRKK